MSVANDLFEDEKIFCDRFIQLGSNRSRTTLTTSNSFVNDPFSFDRIIRDDLVILDQTISEQFTHFYAIPEQLVGIYP